MRLPGIVTNITAFGVFVDIGVHQDGLVHISELSDRFVKNPNEVVKVHQKVMVTVLNVEVERKRISLSMKGGPLQAAGTREENRDASKAKTGTKKGERREPPRKESAQKRFSNSPFAEALKNQ